MYIYIERERGGVVRLLEGCNRHSRLSIARSRCPHCSIASSAGSRARPWIQKEELFAGALH